MTSPGFIRRRRETYQEMSDQYYYRNRAAEAVGPVGLQELLEARAAGEIRDDFVYPEGQAQWVKFEELFPRASIAAQTPKKSALKPMGTYAQAQPSKVTVVDIDMPFFSMVGFMVKWAVAAVPAMAILFGVGVFFVLVFTSVAALWK